MKMLGETKATTQRTRPEGAVCADDDTVTTKRHCAWPLGLATQRLGCLCVSKSFRLILRHVY